jgi:hypothetical protein
MRMTVLLTILLTPRLFPQVVAHGYDQRAPELLRLAPLGSANHGHAPERVLASDAVDCRDLLEMG